MGMLEAMLGRRSVRLFDAEHEIPRALWREIFSVVTRAPSSINLQPWRFVVVDTAAGKAKLEGLVHNNQRQLASCSAMVLIVGDLQFADYADLITAQSIEEGHMSPEIAQHYLAHIAHYRLQPDLRERVILDTSLAAMQLMLAVKAYGYDSNAIGGFEREATLKALCLDPRRYVPVMLLAVGKAAKAGRSTPRLPLDYVLSFEDGLGLAQPTQNESAL